MSIITYPLNGITYDADDAATYLCTRNSGVFADSSCFDLTISGDMEITISTGQAWIKNTDFAGKSVCMNEDAVLSVSIGESALNRIDRVVLRFDKEANETTLTIDEGTAASSASAPDVTQTETIYELGLYLISVPAGTTELSSDMITDTRQDESVCGIMSDGVNEISTADFQEQANALIESYENKIAAVESNSGLMLIDTYDPAGGAEQVAFANEITLLTGANYAGDENTALGESANAAGEGCVAIGYGANAGQDIFWSVAVGAYSRVREEQSTAVGYYSVSGSESVALGHLANANTTRATALGASSCANANCVAVGYGADAANSSSIAIGINSSVNGADSVAIGANAAVTVNSATVIGNAASAGGTFAVAIGNGANAGLTRGISIGSAANSNGQYAVAIGSSACASANYAISMGSSSTAAGVNSTAVGRGANATAVNAVAIGALASAGSSSIAVGVNVRANGSGAAAFGYYANASGNYSTALGTHASASGNYSTALGCQAVCANANSIQLGNASNLSSLTCKVSLTTTSDIRDKTDITEVEDGAIDFLNRVKAIRYVFNAREMYIDEENLSDEDREKKAKYGLCAYDIESWEAGTKKGSRVRVGVSAQEVQEALKAVYGDESYANLVNDNLYDFDPDEIPEDVENQLTVNYSGFVPFLIKAVQELDGRITALEDA